MSQELLWDLNTSIKASEFSEIVYNSDKEISDFCDSKGYFEKEIIKDLPTETLVLVAFNGLEIISCARGTKNIRNWLTDADISMTYWNVHSTDNLVHRGFKNAHQSVWNKVEASIYKFKNNLNIPINFFGHSLGASLVLLQIVAWSEKYGVGNELCYNFGQPRVGNRAFANYIDKLFDRNTIFRHIHLDDPIPRIPYRMGKYLHNNYNEIYWDIKNKPIPNPYPYTKIQSDLKGVLVEGEHFLVEGGREIIDKLFGIKNTMKGQLLFPLLSDHFILQYKNVIKNYKELTDINNRFTIL